MAKTPTLIQAPVINLNGTSANELINQNIMMQGAIRDAIMELSRGAPHPRDFQTAPPGAYDIASEQHEVRIAALTSILKQFDIIGMDLADQRDERNRLRNRKEIKNETD